MNNTVKRKTLSKKVIAIICTIVLIILLPTSWFAYTAFSPKPLGDKLEYIGKQDYGCIVFCDSRPGSVYYYATDMNIEQIEAYFNNAVVKRPSEDKMDYAWIWLKNKVSSQTFLLNYYNQEDSQKLTHKREDKNIISITSEQYATALDSLR